MAIFSGTGTTKFLGSGTTIFKSIPPLHFEELSIMETVNDASVASPQGLCYDPGNDFLWVAWYNDGYAVYDFDGNDLTLKERKDSTGTNGRVFGVACTDDGVAHFTVYINGIEAWEWSGSAMVKLDSKTRAEVGTPQGGVQQPWADKANDLVYLSLRNWDAGAIWWNPTTKSYTTIPHFEIWSAEFYRTYYEPSIDIAFIGSYGFGLTGKMVANRYSADWYQKGTVQPYTENSHYSCFCNGYHIIPYYVGAGGIWPVPHDGNSYGSIGTKYTKGSNTHYGPVSTDGNYIFAQVGGAGDLYMLSYNGSSWTEHATINLKFSNDAPFVINFMWYESSNKTLFCHGSYSSVKDGIAVIKIHT